MNEMRIEKIAYQWSNPHGIWVILKEKRKPRLIPILVGQFEGVAILQGLEKVKLYRPFTHDLLAATLETLGAKVKHIILTDWKEETQTFFASIVVESNGATHRIDARPSDAIALAVRKKAPIFAEDSLLGIEQKSKKPPARKVILTAPQLVTLWPAEKESKSKPARSRKMK